MRKLNFLKTKAGLLKTLLFVSLIVIFFKCRKEDEVPTPTPTPTSSAAPKLTVMSNSTDPLLMSALTQGKTIEYFGQRDANGTPTVVTDVIIKSSTETLKYKVDPDGRPLKMVANDGTEFEFNWLADDHTVVTVTSSDGSTQINMELKDLKDPSKSSIPVIRKGGKSDRIGKPIDVRITQALPGNKAVNAASGNVIVNVILCGEKSNADVYVRATDNGGGLFGDFPAYLVNKGEFSVSVPTDLAPAIVPSQICQSLAAALDKLCYIKDVPQLVPLMCPTLAAAIASSGIGAPASGTLFVACEATVAGLLLYCNTLGASASPGAPALADAICNAEFLKRQFTADVNLTPYAVALPKNVFGNTVKFNPTGTNVLSVDLGSETAIRSFTLNPPAPVAGQSYVAKVSVFCLPSGSKVTISVVGTDGYQNSETFDITTTQAEAEYSISVPGGAQNVMDKVSLVITLPDGTTLTREAHLVFG